MSNMLQKFNQLPRVLTGMLLYYRYNRILDVAMLANKRVAIIGPADSALKGNLGAFIDGFDLIAQIESCP